MKKPANVDAYIAENEKWQSELALLRQLILMTNLEEGIKWMFPTYMLKGKNIVSIGGFKDFFAIWFHQGATLKDDLDVLINAQKGKTKALRQWRFTAMEDIPSEAVIAYVEEAIQNQKNGNIIKFSPAKKPLIIPPELQEVLDKNDLIAQHFKAFNLTDKRSFAHYISEAKRASTKTNRLEKIIPMILQGISLNDKYKGK